MEVSESRKILSGPFAERSVEDICANCFSEESERIAETGEKFIRYFSDHASSDGVLFKTIKEITSDINIPHQSLSKVLKIMEERKIIYRRNGIIGLLKK